MAQRDHLEVLQEHCAKLAAVDPQTGMNGFQMEFHMLTEVQNNLMNTCKFSAASDEANNNPLYPKNRYGNVLPYDHTRVVLQPIDGVPGSDYINANYVGGLVAQEEGAWSYIATQGPLPHTVYDFWRMIWENNCFCIIALGKLIEGHEGEAKVKFEQYWPDAGDGVWINYFHVQLLSAEEYENEAYPISEITVRKLRLTFNNQTREITQLQYHAWPDMSVPTSTEGFLDLVRLADHHNKPNPLRPSAPSPLCVHCSAGVGRTGTFIAIHAISSKMKLAGNDKSKLSFNLYATIEYLRHHRSFMVQTCEQMIFCYQLLVDRVKQHYSVLHYQKENWFHPDIDGVKANAMLGRTSGNFLFRSSSSDKHLTLAYVDAKGGIWHVRVAIFADGFLCEGDKNMYPDLKTMVANKRKVLKSPILRLN